MPARATALLLSPLLAAAVAIAHPAAAPAASRPTRPLATTASIAAAQAYARSRAGVVAFAVLDGSGRIRGHNRSLQFPSASVVKAMLMVAAMRKAGTRPLPAADRRALGPMVRESDNDAAHDVYARIGPERLRAVARSAGMRHFAIGTWIFDAQITAADQARLFLHIDRLVPLRHREYARALLRSVVSWQRWGIAAVARQRGLRILFKGGWRPGIVHQAALIERDHRRLALVVLTREQPSQAYGEETLAGIARRVLR